MKNNWKEAFKALFDSHNEDERYAEMYFEFIESLLAEQKKELMEDLLAEQKKELMEYVQKEVQERMMKYDSKDGYSNLHDEIMEKVYDDVTDIFKHHD